MYLPGSALRVPERPASASARNSARRLGGRAWSGWPGRSSPTARPPVVCRVMNAPRRGWLPGRPPPGSAAVGAVGREPWSGARASLLGPLILVALSRPARWPPDSGYDDPGPDIRGEVDCTNRGVQPQAGPAHTLGGVREGRWG